MVNKSFEFLDIEKEYDKKIFIYDLVKDVDSIINFYLDHPVCIYVLYIYVSICIQSFMTIYLYLFRVLVEPACGSALSAVYSGFISDISSELPEGDIGNIFILNLTICT